MATQAQEFEVLEPETQHREPLSLVVAPQSDALMLTPVMDLATAKKRLEEFQSFVQGYMKEGEDYGTIPGTPKPTLYQPGADKLNELYGLAPTFPDERLRRHEDWTMVPPLFDYEVTCVLVSKRTGNVIAEGKGSCSSWESKYRWRESKRKCPSCSKETIIKGKEEYGGGWVCFKKLGGCNQKFRDGDAAIESQTVGRVPNDDVADLKNTVLKMAQKRAKIAATLAATRSSGVFTQDMEDLAHASPEPEPEHRRPEPPTEPQQQRRDPPKPEQAASNFEILSGMVSDLTPMGGDLWFKLDNVTCFISKDNADLKEAIRNANLKRIKAKFVPKSTDNRGRKRFWQLVEIREIERPSDFAATDEDVPF